MPIIPLLAVLTSLHLGLPAKPACPPEPPSPSATAWFDFQVDVPAKFVADSAKWPFPDPSVAGGRADADFALVQFVVDTLGVPNARTLRFLKQPETLSAELVKEAVQVWRFTPATAKGCRVPQLVQTPLRWK